MKNDETDIHLSKIINIKEKSNIYKGKISIIVPIYNCENYLSECIESILNQDYKNMEIILVNDGSSDDSLKICKKYKKIDERVILIDKTNTGVSNSRNVALNYATGDYVLFVDADDKLENNLLKQIEFDNNLICYGYKKMYKNKCVNMTLKNDFEIDNKNEIFEYINTTQEIGGYLWNKIFSNKIIKDNNIRFNERIGYCEDLLFINEYIKYCDGLKYIAKPLYYYRMRKSSVSSSFETQKTILDAINIIINEYVKDKKIADDYRYEYLIKYNLIRPKENKYKQVYIDILDKYKTDIFQNNSYIFYLYTRYFSFTFCLLSNIKNINNLFFN